MPNQHAITKSNSLHNPGSMRLALLAIILCLVSSLNAQQAITYSFGSPEDCQGGNDLVVEVTVDDFNNVLGSQFTVEWDPTILTFDETDPTAGPVDYNLPGLGRAQFGFGPGGSFVDQGRFTFSYAVPTTNPETVADGTRVFSIRFSPVSNTAPSTVTGNSAIISAISFFSPSTPGICLFNAGLASPADFVDPSLAACPGAQTVTASTGATGAMISGIESGATDNCTLETVIYDVQGATTANSSLTGINDASNVPFNIGTSTVTYIATDAAGNSSACSFQVTVNPAPVAGDVTIALPDVVLTCADNQAFIDVTVNDFQDAIGIQGTFSFNPAELEYDASAPISDINTNLAGFDANDFDFSAAAAGQITFVWTDLSPVSLPNGTRLFRVPLNVISTPTSTVTVGSFPTPLRVAQLVNGSLLTPNVIVSASTITRNDTQAPVVSNCPLGLTADVDAGSCVATVTFPQPTSFDDCDGVVSAVQTSSLGSGSTFPLGVTTVSYTFTDQAGNTSQCSFDVTVSDNEAPVITGCPSDITVTTASGTCSSSATWSTPTATDNCDPVAILSASHQPGDVFPLGQTTVTYTATDASGTSSTCTFTVTVEDQIDPVFTFCPADQLLSVDPGTCGFSGSLPIPTADDDCGVVSVSPTTPIPSPVPVGVTMVEYVATDVSGNTAICSFSVTVTDNQLPIVTDCPTSPVLLTTAAGSCTAAGSWTVPTFSDDCSSVSVSSNFEPGDQLPLGTTTVVYTGTDANNNEVECRFDVIVSEVDAPEVQGCPAMALEVVAPIGTCESVVDFPSITATDACDSSPTLRQVAGPASGSVFPVGTTAIAFEAEDASGNVSGRCEFEVVVLDNEVPTISCPQDQTYQLDAGNVAASAVNAEANASDNCGIQEVSFSTSGATLVSGTGDVNNRAFNIGVTTVTYTALDVNGNTNTCSFTITVLGPIGAPDITCPSDITLNADASCEAMSSALSLTINSDISQVSSVTYELAGVTTTSSGTTGINDASSELFSLGTTTVTYTATSTNGLETTCSFSVTVVDNQAPTIASCSTDTVRIMAAGAVCEATASFTAPSFNAGCSGMTVSSNVEPGDLLSGRYTTVTYTATAGNGLSTSCTFVIEVTGGDINAINCPSDVVASVPGGACEVAVNWIAPTATNACGQSVSLTSTHVPGDFFPIGQTVVTYNAGAGASAQQCSFTVTVTQPLPIVVDNCPDNIVIGAAAPDCQVLIGWSAPNFSDPCVTPTVTSTHNPGSIFTLGTTTVTYTASTPDGRSATCSFDVTVVDAGDPIIDNCPTDITVDVDPSTCEAIVSWNAITGTDGCGGNVTIVTSSPNGGSFPLGSTTVIVTATDDAGNSSSCSFDVTVEDNQVPVFDCPASITYRSDGRFVSDPDNFVRSAFSAGCNGLLIDFDLPVAQTSCGQVPVRQVGGQPSGAAYPIGFTTLVFEADGPNGTVVECRMSIEILPEPTVQIAQGGQAACVGQSVQLTIPVLRNATISWAGPNGFTSDNDTVDLNLLTASQSGTYSVTTTTEGGCTQTASFDLMVGAAPQPSITTDEFVCGDGNSDLVLQVEDQSGGMIVGWDWSGPNGFSSSLASPIINNVTPAASGTYTVIVTSASGCGSATTSKAITIGAQPNTPLVSVSDPTPCTDQEIIFTGSAYTGTSISYDWTVSPSTGVRLDPVNFVAAFSAETAGSYEVCYTATVGGCASQTVCTTVLVEAMPSLVITGDTDIACTDGSLDLLLEETSGSASSYEWRGPNGASVSNTATLNIANVTASNAGLYTLRAESVNGCVVDTALNITITEQPARPSLQAASLTICLGETVSLTTMDLGGSISYLWSANVSDEDAGIPSINDVAQLTVAPTVPGTITYTLLTSQDGCDSEASTVSIEVLEAPSLTADFVGRTTCVTPSESIELLASGVGVTGFVWTGPNGYSSVLQNPVLTNLSAADAGVYTVNAQNDAGCSASASVTLAITEGIDQLETFFDGDLCRGSTIQLFSEEVVGASYSWTGPSGFESEDQNPVIQSLTGGFSGSYTVQASFPNGCFSPVSDPLTLDILTAPSATVDQFVYEIGGLAQEMAVLANDDLESEDFQLTLTREPVFGEISIGQDGTLSYSSNAETPTGDRFEYEVCYLDCPDLCARALVNIELKYDTEECVITNVLTPNGDGQNDNLFISCVEDPAMNPNNAIQIYNEWGDEVFKASPYLNNWEGTYDGAKLPDGTYYYIFKASPSAAEQRGFLTIYR